MPPGVRVQETRVGVNKAGGLLPVARAEEHRHQLGYVVGRLLVAVRDVLRDLIVGSPGDDRLQRRRQPQQGLLLLLRAARHAVDDSPGQFDRALSRLGVGRLEMAREQQAGQLGLALAGRRDAADEQTLQRGDGLVAVAVAALAAVPLDVDVASRQQRLDILVGDVVARRGLGPAPLGVVKVRAVTRQPISQHRGQPGPEEHDRRHVAAARFQGRHQRVERGHAGVPVGQRVALDALRQRRRGGAEEGSQLVDAVRLPCRVFGQTRLILVERGCHAHGHASLD